MYQIEVYENLDGKGIKKSGGLDTPSLRDALALWAQLLLDSTRSPGAYATFFDSTGEVARKTW